MAFRVLEATLPAQAAAGATIVTILDDVPDTFAQPNYVVQKISLTSPSLVTGQATNFATINIRQVRAGSAVATIGTLALNAGTVTLPAETETNVAISGTPNLLAGDTIDAQQVQTGTGLALPAGIVARVEIA